MQTTILDIENQSILLDYQRMLAQTLHKLLLYEDELFLARMLPFLSTLIENHPDKLEY